VHHEESPMYEAWRGVGGESARFPTADDLRQ